MATAVIRVHLCHRCTFANNSDSTTVHIFVIVANLSTAEIQQHLCHRCTFVINTDSTTVLIFVIAHLSTEVIKLHLIVVVAHLSAGLIQTLDEDICAPKH
jgi:hypothetical protein